MRVCQLAAHLEIVGVVNRNDFSGGSLCCLTCAVWFIARWRPSSMRLERSNTSADFYRFTLKYVTVTAYKYLPPRKELKKSFRNDFFYFRGRNWNRTLPKNLPSIKLAIRQLSLEMLLVQGQRQLSAWLYWPQLARSKPPQKTGWGVPWAFPIFCPT